MKKFKNDKVYIRSANFQNESELLEIRREDYTNYLFEKDKNKK